MCYTWIQTLSMAHNDTKTKPQVLLFGPLQPMLILVRNEDCMHSYQLTYNFKMEFSGVPILAQWKQF